MVALRVSGIVYGLTIVVSITHELNSAKQLSHSHVRTRKPTAMEPGSLNLLMTSVIQAELENF